MVQDSLAEGDKIVLETARFLKDDFPAAELLHQVRQVLPLLQGLPPSVHALNTSIISTAALQLAQQVHAA